jgi:hypothetical protein
MKRLWILVAIALLSGASLAFAGGRAQEKFLSPTIADGINDVATFGIEADQVSIYDLRNRRVYSGSRNNGPALVWNCRDENGSIVESGLYIAMIRQNDGTTIYQSFAVAK